MKVKVCKKCSNVDIDKLEKLSDEYGFKLKTGCLGHCKKGQKDQSFGEIKSKFVKVKDSDEFIKKVTKKSKKANESKKKKKDKKKLLEKKNKNGLKKRKN